MAETFTPVQLTSLTNQTTAINQLNSNFSTLATLLNDVLSRSGTSPNQMAASLDMNSNRILNLPTPVGLADPLRLQDATTPLQLQVLTSAANVTSNTVYAGPSSGSATLPTFRSLVSADLPNPYSSTSISQGFVFAGPSSGSGTPTFRALTVSDIPGVAGVTSIQNSDGTLTDRKRK